MSQLFTHRQTHAPTPLLFHSPTLTSPNAVRSTRNENKRLEFRVWHQIEFSSHRPPTPSVSASSFFCFCFSSSLPHRSVLSFKPKTEKKKKKNLEEELIFFPSKTNLMEKKKKTTQVFFVFLFYVFIYIYLFFKFKAQCLSVFQSVFTPRFSVRTWRHMSRTVCSYSFTSLLCAL